MSCSKLAIPHLRGLLAAVMFAVAALAAPAASAQEAPGAPALDALRNGRKPAAAIENRFFLKERRFEFSARAGYVPNNSFAARYVGGIILNYHLNEQLAVGADITYSPDFATSDLKSLVGVLLDRAQQAGGNETFRQPLDKVTLGAAFGVTWAPVYGKINLLGETVLNFDLHGFAGFGMISKVRYFASHNGTTNPERANDVVQLETNGNAVFPAPTIGIGQNYFLNQTLALKLDVKWSFYVDDRPQYNVNIPPEGKQLYNNFVVGVGIAAFFPKMKPRLYDF